MLARCGLHRPKVSIEETCAFYFGQTTGEPEKETDQPSWAIASNIHDQYYFTESPYQLKTIIEGLNSQQAKWLTDIDHVFIQAIKTTKYYRKGHHVVERYPIIMPFTVPFSIEYRTLKYRLNPRSVIRLKEFANQSNMGPVVISVTQFHRNRNESMGGYGTLHSGANVGFMKEGDAVLFAAAVTAELLDDRFEKWTLRG